VLRVLQAEGDEDIRTGSISDPQVEAIELVSGARLSDRACSYLAAFHNLTRLTLRGSSVTDDGLKILEHPRLRSVRELYLSSTGISGAAMRSVAKLTDLRVLYVEMTRVDDAGVGALKPLTALEKLGLGGTDVTASGLAHLAKFSHLAELYLELVDLTHQGQQNAQVPLQHIVKLPLSVLGLQRTGLGDKAAIYVAGIKTLVELIISGNKVTLQALKQFASHKSLKRLTGTGLKAAELTSLVQALPGVEIS